MSLFKGEKLVLSMDKINELHENIKSALDLTT